ncbi:MAG: glycosyltransferase family 4 protein, partial [Candidatus Erginobacter occultus]|nr:glycosyltransferase family 4 protein [Candidatus Erginobacter occultus]
EVRTVPAGRGLSDRAARSRLLFTRPSPVAAAASRRFRIALGELLASGSYDCVQLQGFSMGQYARAVPEEVPRVLVLPELAGEVLRRQVWLARGLKKYYYFRQWKLSRYWEKWYAIWSGNVFVTSLKDRRTVDSWDIGVRTFIMPPPIDPGLFSLPEKKSAAGRILFIGDFHRPGTVDAVIRLKEEIMGRVQRECPEANCLVAGADPPERIRRLAAADFKVTGRVERVDSLLAPAALLAAPLRVAGGISLEIVEALAAGCPVVATRLANSGVGARDGREIVLADRPEDFAAAVVRLLKSPGERERLGRSGRNYVREKFDREKSREKMLEAYRRIAGC